MDLNIIIVLICSGLLVGFINTLAGGGTIISLTTLMWLGLPISIANGTNRVAVFFQTLTAVGSFQQSHLIDWKKSIKIGIPTILGSVAGSLIAVKLDEKIIEQSFAIIMIMMLGFIVFKPSAWLKGNESILKKPIRTWMYPTFFMIGIYGGFIHVGIGYYLLAAIVLGLGFDLVKANAIKVLMVLLYVPFTLVVFIWTDQVNWSYGLVHAIGNVAGALIASRLAIKKGAGFVRIILIILILAAIIDITGLISLKEWFVNFTK
ncbi:MAG: hypothetical protein C0592_00120 [Marinilabiliales bacterium]|nr:MAG: hypothetical protein C0592_00120 [Marinilabiliales bacterium]